MMDLGFEHNRRSIRLKDYDYTTPGAYFVTICVQKRLSLLGDIRDERMILNPAGQMVKSLLNEIPLTYPSVALDVYVIMPNHVHFILWLTRDVKESSPTKISGLDNGSSPSSLDVRTQLKKEEGEWPSLSQVLQWYKSISTAKYRQGVMTAGWTPFPGRFWQRNYFEHIVRNERELTAIREYIEHNPFFWFDDPDHPDNCNR